MQKSIEGKSYANNITSDTYSHTSNTQIENTNAIFTSEKLDKLDELEDMLKDLKINDTAYYVSNSATANDRKTILQAIHRQLLTIFMGRERLRAPETEVRNKNY